jgi:DNA invertase Pin-like site-specific DNA recombinase
VTTLDAYIRVSRVGGRKGESYRSPDQQLSAMQSWAASHDIRIGRVVKDEDVSGKRAVKDRGLEPLIDRAEKGITDGIIVWRLNRFGRNMAETVAAVKRLKDSGTRLVAVDEGYDSTEAGGVIKLGIFAALAEQQLEERTTNWKNSCDEAVEEGKHVACRAPIGYRRHDQTFPEFDASGKLEKNARLVVDPATAPVVREAFELRARGESLKTIAEHLRAGLNRPRLARSGATSILKNPVYKGEARGPNGAVNPDAHEPIVTSELWSAAQRSGKPKALRDGSLASQSSLAGIITCASCGRRLMIMGRTNKTTGERMASYVCTATYNGYECERPAIGDVKAVDEFVIWALSQDGAGAAKATGNADANYVEARDRLRDAELALSRYVEDLDLEAELGADVYARGRKARAAAVEAARTALWELDDPGLPDDAEIVTLGGASYVYRPWGEDPAADRRALRRVIGTVKLAKCDPKRRRWQPLDERIELRWADGSLPDIPSLPKRVSVPAAA